jgi:ATP-dependent DNA ligase
VLAIGSERFVIDGEILVLVGGRPSFDDLLQRIHPAASRVKRLAAETPAKYVVFDLLEDAKEGVLTHLPLAQRRKRLEAFARKSFPEGGRTEVSPATTDPALARRWFESRDIGLDGIVAKRLDFDYRSGDRTGMQKVKRLRTADCVVGGFRYASKRSSVGSLLLGLYDEEGVLHHVGFTSSFKAAEVAELTRKIEALRRPVEKGGGFTGRAPGGPSRWSTERSGEWEPVAPKLVVEVQWDHFTGGRFRHGTKLLRFRPDKAPRQCTLDQVLVRPPKRARRSRPVG